MNKHYDAWHHPVLGYLDMIAYFWRDAESVGVIRSAPMHRVVILPNICIILDKNDLSEVVITKVYPGGSERLYIKMKNTSIEALRRLYRQNRGGWHVKTAGSVTTFERAGRAFICPGGRDVFQARA